MTILLCMYIYLYIYEADLYGNVDLSLDPGAGAAAPEEHVLLQVADPDACNGICVSMDNAFFLLKICILLRKNII